MQVLQVNLGPAHQMATPKQHHIINMTQIGWNNQTNINIINNNSESLYNTARRGAANQQ